jgi:hypothetical protein
VIRQDAHRARDEGIVDGRTPVIIRSDVLDWLGEGRPPATKSGDSRGVRPLRNCSDSQPLLLGAECVDWSPGRWVVSIRRLGNSRGW